MEENLNIVKRHVEKNPDDSLRRLFEERMRIPTFVSPKTISQSSLA